MKRNSTSKLEAALELIDEIFSDTSVSREKTREQLEELAAEIEVKLMALGDA